MHNFFFSFIYYVPFSLIFCHFPPVFLPVRGLSTLGIKHPLTQLDITTSFHKSLSSAGVQDPVFLALTSLHALFLLFYSNDFCHWHWLVMLLCPNCRKLHLYAINNITDWNLESTSAQVPCSPLPSDCWITCFLCQLLSPEAYATWFFLYSWKWI